MLAALLVTTGAAADRRPGHQHLQCACECNLSDPRSNACRPCPGVVNQYQLSPRIPPWAGMPVWGRNDSKTRHPEAGTSARTSHHPCQTLSLRLWLLCSSASVPTRHPKPTHFELSTMSILSATLVSKLTTLVLGLPPGVLLMRQKAAVSSRGRLCLFAVSIAIYTRYVTALCNTHSSSPAILTT